MLIHLIFTVKYQFETSPGDIEFSIKFVTFTEDDGAPHVEIPEDIISAHRVPSDTEIISGQFRISSAGMIMFKWNNDYSWFTTKQLSYLIELAQVGLCNLFCL
jgi:hypothetical protein